MLQSTYPFSISIRITALHRFKGLQQSNGGVASFGQRKLLTDADSRSSVEREVVPSISRVSPVKL